MIANALLLSFTGSSEMAANQANTSENSTNNSTSQSGSTTRITSKKKVIKDALGSRTDIGWEHGIYVGEDEKKIQCKYCHKIFSGGVYRLKHYLAGAQKNVGAYTAVTDEVKKQIWDVVSGLQVNLIKKINMGGASPTGATAKVVGAYKDPLAISYLDDDEFEEFFQRSPPPVLENEDYNAKDFMINEE
ncbi:hypothetical protein Ahy_B05g074207 [Arachis hypogaea]|uniref:BED-type domain-containing protein n=1 Tax=Arachis hypogaea TaxID=3818 RepID=A0A444YY74_ARAHY|nr:hypothetical protein Ahy_B05g074207 [Arachis hypogaea]